jgi:ubiquinone/menaquinone biosynthesis C-methylase UbiE
MGALAYKRLKKAAGIPALVNGYAHFLPFPAHSFHQVVATFPSEYIYDPAAVGEIYRILTPGGSLILLPLAWITGRRPLEKLAAWLFHSTGQAPAWDQKILAPFHQAGFLVHVERQVRKSSIVLIIKATKPLFVS